MTRRELAKASALGLGAVLSSAVEPTMQAQAAAQTNQTATTSLPAGGDGLTRYVADFIVNTSYARIPAEVIELGKKSILDGFGLALCGSVAATGKISRDYLASVKFAPGGATVLGSGMKAPTRFAALANGIGIHADDYDDTQLAVGADRVYGLLTHPTVPVLPAALAIAETSGLSGQNLMLAYHIGVEVESKIAEAISPRHYQDGFHSTGTCGVFGAAAAAAKLRGLDMERTLWALGIAGSRAGALRENFGTMTKPLQAGQAAETGVVAADLAALGWTATDKILETPAGFFQAAGGGYDLNSILHKLGSPWTFVSPGVSIKPFPSGSLTHPGMTAMFRLIKENKITADQVESVDVGTNRNMPKALIHHQPTTNLQAKFSMEFCMASLLLYGKAGLNQFTDEVVNRPEVQAMIRRVHFGVHPEAEKAGYDKMRTIITIHLRDGRVVSGQEDFAKGSPVNPMSFGEVAEKFEDAAAFAKWPPAKAKAIIAAVRGLETLADVRILTSHCAA